jgi:hypothetical protein
MGRKSKQEGFCFVNLQEKEFCLPERNLVSTKKFSTVPLLKAWLEEKFISRPLYMSSSS